MLLHASHVCNKQWRNLILHKWILLHHCSKHVVGKRNLFFNVMHEEKKVSYTHEFYCIIIYNIVVERKKYFYVMYKEKKVVFEQPLLSGLPLCK